MDLTNTLDRIVGELVSDVMQIYHIVSYKNRSPVLIKGAIHSQLNWAILLCDVIPDGKYE